MCDLSILMFFLLLTSFVRAQETNPARSNDATPPRHLADILMHPDVLIAPNVLIAPDVLMHPAPLAYTTATRQATDPMLEDRNWEPFDAPTLGAQTLLGAAGGGVFVVVGLGIIGSEGGFEAAYSGILVMYLGGSLVGVPLGMLYAGDLMGGEARTGAVFAGSALGTATGVLAFITLKDFRSANAVYIAASLVGPLLGYHLTAKSTEERARRDGLNGLAQYRPTGPRCGSDAFAPRQEIDPLTPGPDITLPIVALRF